MDLFEVLKDPIKTESQNSFKLVLSIFKNSKTSTYKFRMMPVAYINYIEGDFVYFALITRYLLLSLALNEKKTENS